MFSFINSKRLQKRVIENDGVFSYDGGELRFSHGYPVLKLQGSYYRMGIQYGVLLKDRISQLYEKNNDRKKEIIEALPWFAKPFGSMVMAIVAGYSAKRIPRKYIQELTGLSNGSGISFNDMATVAFGGVIFDAACTSILTKADGRILHAQNLDFEPCYLGNYPVIVEYNAPGKFSYTNFGLAGVPGMFHGVNEKGISVTVNYGDGTFNKKNKGLPMGYKLREILENAESIDQVEGILRENGADELGWMLVVCSSREKRAAVYDIFGDDIVQSEFTEEKYKYVINRIFSPERLGTKEYSKKYLQISRGEGIYNIARIHTIDKYLSEKGIDSVDGMIDFLRNYEFYDYEKLVGSMNATVVNERTLHSLIFDSENCSVYFASAPGYSSLSEIVKYDFDTSELVSYKEASQEFSSDDFNKFMEWYGSYQDASLVSRVGEGIERKFWFLKFDKPDFTRVLSNIDLTTYHNPRELWSLFRIWKTDRTAISFKNVIYSCDKAIERYPEFAVLFIIKGTIQKALKKNEKAIASFEKALECRFISDYDRIHLYDELARINKKINNKARAMDYAVLNIRLIESLSDNYSMGGIVGAIYDRMKYYVYKPEQRYNLYPR